MNNSRINIQNVAKIDEEILESSTPFGSVVSNPRIFGSNDAHELEMQLKQIRSSLSDCIKNLELIDYDYNEVVDKDQFNSLKNNYLEEKQLFYSLQQDLSLMEQDIFKLKNLKTKFNNEINQLLKKTDKAKRTLTPRPDWTRCRYVANNGKSFKSSDHLLRDLIKELTGADRYSENKSETSDSDQEKNEEKKSNFFQNFGKKFILVTHRENSDSVQQVFNRKLTRVELEVVLNELFISKIDNDYLLCLNRRSVDKMSRFVLKYFQSKFKSKELALEWVVNIKQSCKSFSDLKLAKLMALVLDDQANDQIQMKFYSSLGSFYLNLMQQTTELTLEQNDIYKLVKNSFGCKNPSFISELASVLKSVKYLWEDSRINLSKLSAFLTCSDNLFARTLERQSEAEKLIHLQNIIGFLKKMNEEIVCREDFLSCIKEIDIECSHNEINKYCRQIFPDSKIMRLDFSEFEQRLKKFFFIS
ncbi:translin-associated factor X-interacting 1-like [Brachionus plicatilis]|uniref:Translin-associated factor X-interacting 1-like n=1 Tax=Brachionus plicatilis TaxID=10195 RepID=A0A3M7S5K0_BRAPC|nr:translin-associated factor X-interacting 1-like [Brachionus plicatilis]